MPEQGDMGGGSASELPAEMEGRDLGCWCPPGPCHADVLLEVANAPMAGMTPRQEYALRHPLSNAADPVGPYRAVEARPNGDLLTTVLAVDR